MTWQVFHKLLAIFTTVAIGWFVGWRRWLNPHPERSGTDPARILSETAFYIFVPALLFRTAARIDFATLPWPTLTSYFIPTLILLFGVYFFQRRRLASDLSPALPSVGAITTVFGNTLQVGVPFASAVFGESGLAIHITVVGLHALTLLTVLTTLVELDLARSHPQRGHRRLRHLLFLTARNTLIHPVVLPVIAGIVWNLVGLGLPKPMDEILILLGSPVAPVCLVVIGMSLAVYGWPKEWKPVLGLVLLKLMVLPLMVLILGKWVLGLTGLRLAVVVLMGALPTGSNALIFAQRYRAGEGPTTTAIVLSTVLFGITAPLWLAIVNWLSPFH